MTEAQFPNTLGNLGLEPNEAEIQNINVGFLPRPSQYPVVPIAAQTCPQILGSAPQSRSIQLQRLQMLWASSCSPPHHANPDLPPHTPTSGKLTEAEPSNPSINNKTLS